MWRGVGTVEVGEQVGLVGEQVGTTEGQVEERAVEQAGELVGMFEEQVELVGEEVGMAEGQVEERAGELVGMFEEQVELVEEEVGMAEGPVGEQVVERVVVPVGEQVDTPAGQAGKSAEGADTVAGVVWEQAGKVLYVH